MDIRLSTALGTSPGTWYGVQASFDLWLVSRLQALMHSGDRILRVLPEAAVLIHCRSSWSRDPQCLRR